MCPRFRNEKNLSAYKKMLTLEAVENTLFSVSYMINESHALESLLKGNIKSHPGNIQDAEFTLTKVYHCKTTAKCNTGQRGMVQHIKNMVTLGN